MIRTLFLILVLSCGFWLFYRQQTNSRFAQAESTAANPVFHSEGVELKRVKVADGLGVVWGMDFLPSGDLIFTERQGKIKLLTHSKRVLVEVKGIPPIHLAGQGGLLDIRVSPHFDKTPWIYLAYSVAGDHGLSTTQVSRSKLVNNKLIDTEILYTATPYQNTSVHYGSRLEFDDQEHLYFSIGERGHQHLAQDLSVAMGKIMRLNLDGTIPADNPFAGDPKKMKSIWTYGHRNPQGLAMNPFTKQLWEEEHGPRGGDEINVIVKGHNYGWPVITYGKNYSGPPDIGEGTAKEGMDQPIKYFVPSIAPSGLSFYSGDKIAPWKGNLFSGALSFRLLDRIVLDEKGNFVKEERLFEKLGLRIRCVRQGPDEFLYFSTDEGQIFRIEPA